MAAALIYPEFRQRRARPDRFIDPDLDPDDPFLFDLIYPDDLGWRKYPVDPFRLQREIMEFQHFARRIPEYQPKHNLCLAALRVLDYYVSYLSNWHREKDKNRIYRAKSYAVRSMAKQLINYRQDKDNGVYPAYPFFRDMLVKSFLESAEKYRKQPDARIELDFGDMLPSYYTLDDEDIVLCRVTRLLAEGDICPVT